MKKPLPKIVVVLGPTAVGKSDLAVAIAAHFNGEVVSADSRQVYRGMNIGTGKVTKKEMVGIRHHLLDVADPKRRFSVAQFERLGTRAIKDILRRGKLPIICGGTGFYIDALLGNVTTPNVPPNYALRKRLATNSAPELFATLARLDPRRARTIDRHNPHRLIRAIEIATALGRVPAVRAAAKRYNVLSIGLVLPRDVLRERISRRLAKRMRAGMLAEAKRLHAQGLSLKRMRELGLEYQHLADVLDGKIETTAMSAALAADINRYAKRQMTWFKRNPTTKWFAPGDDTKILPIVQRFLRGTKEK